MQLFKVDSLKLILLGITVSLVSLFLAIGVTAQEPNGDTQTSPPPSDKVQQLKDKLATKVAELRESQTRGFAGEIAAVSKTSFTLVTKTGEVRVRTDENTVVYKSPDRKTEGALTDLKNTQTAAILGIYEEDSKQLTARVILMQNLPTYTNGEVAQLDKTNNAVTVKTTKGETVVDFEKNTTAFEYLNGQISKSGFSRLSSGDVTLVWGNPNENDESRISATKIIRLPAEVFSTARTEVPSTSPQASPKTSPSATPRATPKPSSTP